MNVVNVFDGMGCGQIALERAGLKVNNYFASEIDKAAMTVTQSNYPNTVQVGDISKLCGKDFPKVDLLMGGSPCQGFSLAGLQLAFNDPRSKLFFEFVRLYEELKKENPDIKFLLENVRMAKAHQDVITQYMGVQPTLINSSTVSAQSRNRVYWTNLTPAISQPLNTGTLVKDILENEVDDRYFITGKWFEYLKRNGDERFKKHLIGLSYGEKAICHTARAFANWNGNFVLINETGGAVTENKTGRTISDMLSEYRIRRLTPIECERLQTVPDNYTKFVSDAQRYRMTGNGWTVDVIAHILEYAYF